MSVNKTLKDNFDGLFRGLNSLSTDLKKEIHVSLVDFSKKLEGKKSSSFKSRVIAFRNWLTHALLWLILAHLLTSCFVSGRTIHVATPKVSIEADTATAFTLPYKNNSVTY